MKDRIRDIYQQISKTTFESVELSFKDKIQYIDVRDSFRIQKIGNEFWAINGRKI